MNKATEFCYATDTSSAEKLRSFISSHRRSILIADEASRRYCLTKLIEIIGQKFEFEYVLDNGEGAKSMFTAEKIISIMMRNGFDRRSAVINLGGGRISDIGGFVASIFKRGVDYCNIPTTLLAMADASIGGKTAVNIGGIKNQAGSFYFPSLIYFNMSFLSTLPESEIRSGFAEVIKHALLAGGNFWKMIADIERGAELKISEEMLRLSTAYKNEIVISDPEESGRRKFLNLGHTIGHAFESLCMHRGGEITHGHAVAEGIIAESLLSVKQGLLSSESQGLIQKVLRRYFQPIKLSDKDVDEVIDFMASDKKNFGGKIIFTLLKEIGQPVVDVGAEAGDIRESINKYRGLS